MRNILQAPQAPPPQQLPPAPEAQQLPSAPQQPQQLQEPPQPQPAVKPPDQLPSEQPTPPEQPATSRNALSRQMRMSLLGVAFIVAGLAALLALVTQSVLLGVIVVPLLGVMFLTVAVVTGGYGAFIPGSILTGLGLGLLVSQLWLTGAPENIQGSIPVIGLGLGFVAITPLCWYVNKVQMVWPLIPGAILLISGVGLLLGITQWGAYVGPLALVAVGCYLLIWRARRPRDAQDHLPRRRERASGG